MVADAAHEPRSIRLKRGAVNLARGQLLASSRFLAARWQWPEPRVRRFLDRLSGRRANDAQGVALNDAQNDAQNDALIDALPTPNGTIITIRNYDSFQGKAKPKRRQIDALVDAPNDARSDAQLDAPGDVKSTQREKGKTKNTQLKLSERGALATRIPLDFDLDNETRSWALTRLGTAEAVSASVDRFRDHYLQVAGDRGLSRAWQRKVRLWIDADAKTLAQTDSGRQSGSVIQAADRLVKKIRSFDAGASDVIAAPTDAEWDSVLSTYRKIGRWTRHVASFGDDPTSPNCRAPRHLLAKHGLPLDQAKASALSHQTEGSR